MKKIVFALLVIMIPCFIEAQVTLQPNLPVTGLIQKNQLWNVLVINSSAKQYDCRLDMVLRDRVTGQEVMTATSGQFVLLPGSKQLNADVVAPVQYNYILAGINNKIQGLLPAGSYTACYSLINKETDLAQECIPFDTEPLSPPILIQPADSSILEAAPNQFSWIPPTPEGMFDRLQYDVIITAVNEGQKANEAIEENVPFYNDGNHITNMLSYPASLPAFENDKWYAWQVVARDNRDYAGKSETWVFKVKQDRVAEIIKMAPFLKMTARVKEVSTVHQGVLKLEYYNFLTDSVAVILVYGEKESMDQAKKTEVKITRGQNFIQHDISKKMQLSEGSIYNVVLINSRGEKFFIKFRPKNYR